VFLSKTIIAQSGIFCKSHAGFFISIHFSLGIAYQITGFSIPLRLTLFD
jgi:hypothetical protein